MKAQFVGRQESAAQKLDLWPALIVSKEEIEVEVERLAALSPPESGRRTSLIVHPRAAAPGLGLAPGIQVALHVLKPGERSRPVRHNSTAVQFCIRGGGRAVVDGREFSFGQFDVWNLPSMSTNSHVNDTSELQVRLAYSNAALLEKMNVHIVEDVGSSSAEQVGSAIADRPVGSAIVDQETLAAADDPARTNPFGVFRLTDDGAFLMPYEQLINPPVVESRSLHWPWRQVKEHLDRLEALGRAYVGRRLYLLYNPATGRTNGTTPNFFATMTIRPPKIVDRPHRHTSAAINYYFSGSGRSVVEGTAFEWKAGDLMFSAPGWGVHNHSSHDEPVYELTIQDSPLNIAMESLLWQESLKGPVAVLGAERGFDTNRSDLK